MHDPIEGQFRVVGEKRRDRLGRNVIAAIEFVATLLITAAIMIPVSYVMLLISRAVFPAGPL